MRILTPYYEKQANKMEKEIIKKIIDIVLSIPLEKWEKNMTTMINDTKIYLRVDVSFPSGVIMIGATFISEESYKYKIEAYSQNVINHFKNIEKINRESHLQKIYDSIKSI